MVGQPPICSSRRQAAIHLAVVPVVILILTSGLLPGLYAAPAAFAAALLAAVSAQRLFSLACKAQAETKCLDAQLVQSQKLAAIGELSAGLAHEINNPLAIISQEAEWADHLLSDAAWNGQAGIAEVRDSIRQINHQVVRCSTITHKLLGFGRKMEPAVQPTDVNRLVEDMVVLMEKEAALRSITVARKYASSLPQLHTDPPLLRQVVLNLLTNAVQAIESNGTVTVSTCGEAEAIAITVADTGPGIPNDILPRIFDPFFTTKPPGKGTGLGLSVSHGIVYRLGGRIDVESAPGRGASFTIRLPSGEERHE